VIEWIADLSSAALMFTEHALKEMKRRGLDESIVRLVVAEPEQELMIRPGRFVLQSRINMEKEKFYLVRVFVDADREPQEVVTAYRTSKISKYWKESHES
jgi:hypothetical protein